MIIGIAGRIRSGKTTAAKYLQNLLPNAKLYSFADLLKQNVAIDILGLTEEQCNSHKKKDEKTHLQWEKMPGAKLFDEGKMTVREVLQYVGTEIFRKIQHDVWAQALLRKIKKESLKYDFALIHDERFINEAEIIQHNKGKNIYLTRNPSNNSHRSETELDNYNQFDHVIDNKSMTEKEKNHELWKICKKENWI